MVNMKSAMLVVSSACLLLSCANQPPNFAKMSLVELEAYNDGKPIMKQIYCQDERRTGSHIRKKWCRTVEEWVLHNTRAMMALDTMSTRNYNALRGGN